MMIMKMNFFSANRIEHIFLWVEKPKLVLRIKKETEARLGFAEAHLGFVAARLGFAEARQRSIGLVRSGDQGRRACVHVLHQHGGSDRVLCEPLHQVQRTTTTRGCEGGARLGLCAVVRGGCAWRWCVAVVR
ncbi:hypothetical protein PHAVU_011G028701 [Phaseolus vulgaris]